ncbi:unnamed protein product [Symbiodinium microadriaticum]|nr:unnamed protein product [Symbiodinium microadriaticum]
MALTPMGRRNRSLFALLLLLFAILGPSWAWLGLTRRLLVACAFLPQSSRADAAAVAGSNTVSGPPRVMQSQIKFPDFIRMEGPTGDFSINIPTAWRAEFENIPGRLVYAVENAAGFNSATLQVARLELSKLLAAAGTAPSKSKTSDWQDVVVANITEATVAQILMAVAQQGLSTEPLDSFAKTIVLNTEIEAPEPNADASSLLWQAKAVVDDFRGSRIISGRALLRQGVVVFAVATGSERFGAVSSTISTSGFGWEYNNRLVGSLRLRRR